MGCWDRCLGESLIVLRCSSSTNDSLPLSAVASWGSGLAQKEPVHARRGHDTRQSKEGVACVKLIYVL